jgi:hypothetical protein
VKIGKLSRGSPTAKTPSGRRKVTSTESGAEPLAVERTDVVSLSTESTTGVQAPPVEGVQPAPTATEGPLPDPRETSEAIIKKELEIIFREVYL